MATLSITIPDNVYTRVVTALAAQGNYQATLADGSQNPVTQAAFARQMVLNYIQGTVAYQESKAAQLTAAQNSASQITLS